MQFLTDKLIFFPSALKTTKFTNFHRPHSVFPDFQGPEELIPFFPNFQRLCEPCIYRAVSEQKVHTLDRFHQSPISFKLKVKTYVKDRCTTCENLLLCQCCVWSPLESSAPPLLPQCVCNWNHGNSIIIIIISLSLTFVVVLLSKTNKSPTSHFSLFNCCF